MISDSDIWDKNDVNQNLSRVNVYKNTVYCIVDIESRVFRNYLLD